MNTLTPARSVEQRHRIAEYWLGLQVRASLTRWAPLPLRLIVGYGFLEHGLAKAGRGLDAFPTIVAAMGLPFPYLLGWLTILVEIFGGLAFIVGAFIPLASIPMVAILFVATTMVHLQNGFSSIKLQAITPEGPRFGQPGYETDLLYVACIVALVLTGPGPLSLNSLIRRRFANSKEEYRPAA